MFISIKIYFYFHKLSYKKSCLLRFEKNTWDDEKSKKRYLNLEINLDNSENKSFHMKINFDEADTASEKKLKYQ